MFTNSLVERRIAATLPPIDGFQTRKTPYLLLQ
jgi:hypothetical protein